MFSTNYKISDQQLKKMLVFDMISISILIIPHIAAGGAGRDGLTAIVLASAAACAYALVMLFFCKRIKQDYMQHCRLILGKAGTCLFGFLYLLKFLSSAVFVLSLFTNVIHETILSNTGSRTILLCLILISAFYASKVTETRARMVELLYYLILIPLFLLFLSGILKINPANLLPLFTAGTAATVKTGYNVLLTFSAVELILFATPSMVGDNENNKFRRKVMQAIFVTTAFNCVVFMVVAGLLGVPGAAGRIWSTVSVMHIIEIPGGVVYRQDAIMLSLWLVSIFTITSSLIHYLCQVTKAVTGVKKQGAVLSFYSLILFLLTMNPLKLDTLYYLHGKYLAYIGFPQSIILPLILVTAGALRKEKCHG